jgi:hypothetical protein
MRNGLCQFARLEDFACMYAMVRDLAGSEPGWDRLLTFLNAVFREMHALW